MEENVNKNFYEKAFIASAILFLLGGIAFFETSQQFQTHLLVFGVTASLIVAASALRIRSRAKMGSKAVGEAVIQGGWLWTSLSLVYVLMPPAKIYKVTTIGEFSTIIIGVILAIGGVYTMIKAKRETGVHLTI